MSTSEIIELISLGITAAGLIFGIVAAIVRGNMKDFIIKCMEDAERTGMSGKTKYEFRHPTPAEGNDYPGFTTHSKKANMLWIDGHVSGVRILDMNYKILKPSEQ